MVVNMKISLEYRSRHKGSKNSKNKGIEHVLDEENSKTPDEQERIDELDNASMGLRMPMNGLEEVTLDKEGYDGELYSEEDGIIYDEELEY